jgi:hypothetical protein
VKKDLCCALLVLLIAGKSLAQGEGMDDFYRLGPDSLPQEGVPKGEIVGPDVLPCEIRAEDTHPRGAR